MGGEGSGGDVWSGPSARALRGHCRWRPAEAEASPRSATTKSELFPARALPAHPAVLRNFAQPANRRTLRQAETDGWKRKCGTPAGSTGARLDQRVQPKGTAAGVVAGTSAGTAGAAEATGVSRSEARKVSRSIAGATVAGCAASCGLNGRPG